MEQKHHLCQSSDFTDIPKMTEHNQIQPSNLCWPSFIYQGFLDACCIWLQDFAGSCMNVFLFQSSGTAELPVACKPEKTRWNVCSNQTVNLLYALSPQATTWMMLLIREIHNLVFSAQGRTKNYRLDHCLDCQRVQTWNFVSHISALVWLNLDIFVLGKADI